MHSEALIRYCERHGYKLIQEYTTLGINTTHYRATVLTPNNEVNYLYFDRSSRRKTVKQQQDDLSRAVEGEVIIYTQRGWRNTTVDNQRKRERINRQHEASNMTQMS